ncbi:MAG: biotin/lipoyl-binding protein, partial [Alphaproteobacteria bacterium]
MRRRRILVIAILAAAAAVAGGYLYVQSRPRVTVVVVTRGQAIQAVYATGAVEPMNWAKVAPTTTGRIIAILARDGQPVRQGDPLVQLDEREESARLTELEARARYWREEAERQRSLMMRGVAT